MRHVALVAVLGIAALVPACGGDADGGGEGVQGTTPAMEKAREVGADIERISGTATLVKKDAGSADYPLTTCVVSGQPLDSMNGPVVYDYGGIEVQFCCDNCIDDFKATPRAFLDQIEKARGR